MANKLPVPVALTKGISLRTIDFSEAERQATANAQGVATVEYDQLQQGHYWRVERLVVSGDSQNLCNVFVYTGDQPIPQRQRDGTPLPSGIIAVSEYPSFLTILPTSLLMVVITGANPGDVFSAAAQYQLVQKVVGQWA